MRTGVPLPVKRALREPVNDVAVERVWRAILGRRATVRRSRPARVVVAIAATLVLSAALVLVLVRPWRASAPRAMPGPLQLADGTPLGVIEGTRASARGVTLSDGSLLTLKGDSRLEPVENTGSAFVSTLRGGPVEFDVQPGGPRRWTIECAMATVEIVGTRFTLESSPSRLRAHVEHGVVLVRGEHVPDRVQRLTDGQELDVEPTAAEPATVASVTPTAMPSSSAAALHASDRPTWRELASRAEYSAAYGALGEGGVARASRGGTVDDLLTLADVARLSGHPAEAVAPLSTILDAHADDPRASVAAFTLGRLELDALSDPARAADAFARAIQLGAPAGLEEDAYLRLVEARARAGDKPGARSAAAEYRKRFPGGSRAAAMDPWIDGD